MSPTSGRTKATVHHGRPFRNLDPGRAIVRADSRLQRLTGTTYTAANNLVARMADNRLLREFTRQARNRRFMYQSYVDLFHDTEAEAGTGTMVVE